MFFLGRLFGLFNILSYCWTCTFTPFSSSLAALAGPQLVIFEFFKNRFFYFFFYLSTVAGVTFLTKTALLPCF
jgi:hypothetical protein